MLEENTKDIDLEYLSIISRYYLKPSRKNRKAIIDLAERGQLNAAVFCLKQNYKFDKTCFYLNFVNLFGKNEKYLKLIFMFEEYNKFRYYTNLLDRVASEASRKNWELGTHTFPLIWTKNGEIQCIDKNLVFDPFIKSEKLRAYTYANLRDIRKNFMDTKYFKLKCEVSEIFLKEFLNDKPQFATILNMLDKIDNIVIFEPEISDNMERLIYFDYMKHKQDDISSFNFADMIMLNFGSDHSPLLSKNHFDYDTVDEAHQIFNNLCQKSLVCESEKKEK